MPGTFPFENMNMDAFLAFIANNKPHWADDVIQPWPWDESDRLVKEQFISAHYWCGNASINIFQVVGVDNSTYSGRTWLQFLNSGKQMDINIPLLIKNPTYYSDVKLKQPMMYFKTWDGLNYFVNNDGVHRTVLCRFYYHFIGETQIHGVTVEHFKINETFYALFKEVADFIKQYNLAIMINPVRTSCGRDDTAGWKIDYFKTLVTWYDVSETGVTKHLNELELKLKFETLKRTMNKPKQQKPIRHSWFKRFKKMYNIK